MTHSYVQNSYPNSSSRISPNTYRNGHDKDKVLRKLRFLCDIIQSVADRTVPGRVVTSPHYIYIRVLSGMIEDIRYGDKSLSMYGVRWCNRVYRGIYSTLFSVCQALICRHVNIRVSSRLLIAANIRPTRLQ